MLEWIKILLIFQDHNGHTTYVINVVCREIVKETRNSISWAIDNIFSGNFFFDICGLWSPIQIVCGPIKSLNLLLLTNFFFYYAYFYINLQ